MFSIFFLMLFGSLWNVLFAKNDVEIERRLMKYTDGTLTYQPDTFKLPSSMCSGDGSAECGAMGVHSIGNCTCECTIERATFGFYDNQWSCTANTKVRRHEGCSLKLLKRTDETPLIITVPATVPANNIPYEMPTAHRSCYIIPLNSTYLKCNGTREMLENVHVYGRFSIERHNGLHFVVFKSTTADEVKPGTIIRISIGCHPKRNVPVVKDCLTLKMEGIMKCPEFVLPTLTKPTTSQSMRPPTSAVQVTASTTTNVTSTTIEADKPNKDASEEDDDDSVSSIAGAVTGVIVLALIIVVIVIIMRRRKKRNDAAAKSQKTVENICYELGVDNSLKIASHGQRSLEQDEYSYACVDSVPGNRRKIEGENRNNQDPQITVCNHVYGKVEDLDKPGSPPHLGSPVCNTLEAPEYATLNMSRIENQTKSDAPVYNTLEDPSYSRKDRSSKPQGNQNEPLYNVLEGPEYVDGAPEGLEPPCYHVLEGPSPAGAPVYNVLERPGSDSAAVYESLEGHDSRVYGTLDRRDGYTKSALKENRGYNDTLYDSVGVVINDTGDVYQQLNQDGQRNRDVYQALDHKDTIAMDELTSHSNA